MKGGLAGEGVKGLNPRHKGLRVGDPLPAKTTYGWLIYSETYISLLYFALPARVTTRTEFAGPGRAIMLLEITSQMVQNRRKLCERKV